MGLESNFCNGASGSTFAEIRLPGKILFCFQGNHGGKARVDGGKSNFHPFGVREFPGENPNLTRWQKIPEEGEAIPALIPMTTAFDPF